MGWDTFDGYGFIMQNFSEIGHFKNVKKFKKMFHSQQNYETL